MLQRAPASPDFQALIFCGPGVSFNTFTSTPEDNPKALIPIANRPMIWYPLDWCHRANITNVLAPSSLSQNTGTAEILRLPEVQAIITGNFLVLPCDLLCDLAGESLLETWMIHAAGMIGSSAAPGGLGVWCPTGGEHAVKGEETNFLITAQLPRPTVPSSSDSLRPNLSQVVYSSTTDTFNDITESKKSFPIRRGLLRKHGKVRILTTARDAHIYLFPYWILDFINQNPKFDSVSEDVVGWWAKATWQDGLIPKLSFDHILNPSSQTRDALETDQPLTTNFNYDIDLTSLSTTNISNLLTPPSTPPSTTSPSSPIDDKPAKSKTRTTIPPFLSYLHPHLSTNSHQTIIRRIDTTPLLLSASLHLASLPPTSPSPFTTNPKVHPTTTIAARTTISPTDVLVGANTTINQFTNIKNSIVGANCVIGQGVKLTRCVIMDDVEIGEKCALTGCVVGWRSKLGKGCKLGEGCEVAPGYEIEDGVEGAGEVLGGFEGLDEDIEGEEPDDASDNMDGKEHDADDA
ncbi:MAG: hypothetical protein Q9209_005903 [Squamulea sp. 1 TL-2023]